MSKPSKEKVKFLDSLVDVRRPMLPRKKSNAGPPKGVQAPPKPPPSKNATEMMQFVEDEKKIVEDEERTRRYIKILSEARSLTQKQIERDKLMALSNPLGGAMLPADSQGGFQPHLPTLAAMQKLAYAQSNSLANQPHANVGGKGQSSPSYLSEEPYPTVTGISVRGNPDGTFCLEFLNTGSIGSWTISSVPDGIMRALHKQWLMERNRKEDDNGEQDV